MNQTEDFQLLGYFSVNLGVVFGFLKGGFECWRLIFLIMGVDSGNHVLPKCSCSWLQISNHDVLCSVQVTKLVTMKMFMFV